jgi:hypothetical protein
MLLKVLSRSQHPPIYRSMPEFLDYRRLNFGGDFILAVTRYALDTYVTDDELKNPLLAACQTLAIGT